MKILIFITVILSIFLNIDCSFSNSPVAGTETGSGDRSEISCKLISTDSIAVDGVLAILRPTDYISPSFNGVAQSQISINIDSAVTNEHGLFTFDSIQPGSYTIECFYNESNATLIKVEVFDISDQNNLGTRILKPTGSIAGNIVLPLGGDPRKVDIFVMGINRSATLDSMGNFNIDNLAEGIYTLRIRPTLDNYNVFDTLVLVRSQETLQIDSLSLRFSGNPSVLSLAVDYDQQRQIANLSWQSPKAGTYSGYNVYRSYDKGNFLLLTQSPLSRSVTTYSDSVFIEGGIYEYRVTTIDSAGNEGLRVNLPNDSVKITSGLSLSQVDTINGTADIVCAFRNGYLVLAEKYQDSLRIIDSDGKHLVTITIPKDSSNVSGIIDITEGMDGFMYVLDATGVITLYTTTGADTVRHYTVPADTSGRITFANGTIYVVSCDTLRTIDTKSGTVQKRPIDVANIGSVTDIAVSVNGRIYLTTTKHVVVTADAIRDNSSWSAWSTSLNIIEGDFPYRILPINSDEVLVLTEDDVRKFSSSGDFLARYRLGDIITPKYYAVSKRPVYFLFGTLAETVIEDISIDASGAIIVLAKFTNGNYAVRKYQIN